MNINTQLSSKIRLAFSAYMNIDIHKTLVAEEFVCIANLCFIYIYIYIERETDRQSDACVCTCAFKLYEDIGCFLYGLKK